MNDKPMTVEELIAKLKAMPPSAPVKVWLPGTYISPCSVFMKGADVLIEGNVDE